MSIKEKFKHPKLVEKMSQGSFEFVMDLYKESAANKENAFMSPFSISACLVMAFVGSRGETQRQISDVLRLSLVGNPKCIRRAFEDIVYSIKHADLTGLKMRTFTGVYLPLSCNVHPEFRELLTNEFNSLIQNVDFEKDHLRVVDEINETSEEISRTKDVISRDVVDSKTKFLLVNSIFFRGSWLKKFDSNQTKIKRKFQVSQNESSEVEMMIQSGKFKYSENLDLDCCMVQLPYGVGRVEMCVLLPNDKFAGLANLERKLNYSNFHKLLNSADVVDVTVQLPKFKLVTTYSLGKVLAKLGMNDLFSPGKADLTGIAAEPSLHVTEFVHKAVIDVSEKGSGATDGAMEGSAQEGDDLRPIVSGLKFVVNRPFFFVIRDNLSDLILFLGKVTNPNMKSSE